MIVKTRIFELYRNEYHNLSDLSRAMEITVSQVSRVRNGKRNIGPKFIAGH